MAQTQVSTVVGTPVISTPSVIPIPPTTGAPTGAVPTPQQISTDTEIAEEVTTRVEAPVEVGIKKGTVRSVTVDTLNTQSLTEIQGAATLVQQTATTAATSVATDVTASSPTQRVEQLQSQTFVSLKSQQDVVRSLQKLQRRCNHSFSLITNRCNICNKHKDSHYYD